MADKYNNFLELNNARPTSFEIDHDSQKKSILIFTPHGGGIEPGTTEICKWFNKKSYSYYSFTGTGSKCSELHITSTHFDEPILVEMLKHHQYSISFHGMSNNMRNKYNADVFLGGLNKTLIESLKKQLYQSGYSVTSCIDHPESILAATSSHNLTNKCISNQGVQIELSESIRESFFKENYKLKSGREFTTDYLDRFCNIILEIIKKEQN